MLYVYADRTKYYLPSRKGYAVNDLELDESTNVQPLSVIQNPSLVAKPYGRKNTTANNELDIVKDILPIGHLFEPISVEQFKEHVKSLHRNDDYPFSEEYSVSSPSHLALLLDVICYYHIAHRMLNQVMPQPLKQPTTLTMPPRTDMPTYQLVSGWPFHYTYVCMLIYLCVDDHSRVKLAEVLGRPGSDYINANYIDVSSLV